MQKECASLLDDNQKLDREKCAMENDLSEKNTTIEDLEAKINDLEEQKSKVKLS